MLDSAIRELAASKSATWIVAAFFEKTIQIWDLNSRRRISEFPTVFCAGARNLALAPGGEMVVAGASTSQGEVACYELPSGRRIWERKFAYPSWLRFHPSGQSIVCTENRQSVIRLDADTGNTLQIIEGTRQYIEGPSGDTLSIPPKNGNSRFNLIEKGRNFKIDRLGFAVLDAQFSPHFLCLSEARGPVRCISRVDGKLQWVFDPGVDKHVLKLHYSPTTEVFYGILGNLQEGGSRLLLRFDATTGMSEEICDFPSWDEIFLDSADQLITSAGEVRSLSNGALVDRLDFPMREYPED